jgi:hypothetical protein
VRSAALALLFLCAACAATDGPIASDPHLRWAVPAEAAPPGSPTLGVGAIRDARPELFRGGDEPPLEVRFLSVVREGMVTTGDDSFDRPLADATRADVLATLARSGSFASVTEVGFDPRDPSAWPAFVGPDAVLVGELEELSGSQWRSFLVTPFKIGFVRDRWGEPEGRFTARFELWTRTGRSWRGRVRTRADGVDGGAADAALDALARGSELLAARLAAALRPPARPVRAVPLLVLDGCGLGPSAAQRPVDEASAVFLREADLRFEPVYQTWAVPEAARDLDSLLRAARDVAPPRDGAVLAFATEQAPQRRLGFAKTGLAEPLGAHVVALCTDEGAPSALTVTHELAHLFGAVHVRERASIMSPTADFQATFFDPLNRRIVRELRLREFGAPLDARTSARLRAIYRALESAPDVVDPADLAAALGALDGAP